MTFISPAPTTEDDTPNASSLHPAGSAGFDSVLPNEHREKPIKTDHGQGDKVRYNFPLKFSAQSWIDPAVAESDNSVPEKHGHTGI
ncbi:MAG: hypothetical protein QX197_08825 [Methylococcaceae bacterium]